MEDRIRLAPILNFGWEFFKRWAAHFIFATMIMIAIQMGVSSLLDGVSSHFSEAFEPSRFILPGPAICFSYFFGWLFGGSKIILTIIDYAVTVVLQLMFMLFVLGSLRRLGEPGISDVKRSWKRYANAFLATVIYQILVLVGFILLIIPGILIMVRFQYAPLLCVDKGLGPLEALTVSERLTIGNRNRLFLLNLAIFGFIILGILAMVIGILVAIPFCTIAWLAFYRLLNGEGQTLALAPKMPDEQPNS